MFDLNLITDNLLTSLNFRKSQAAPQRPENVTEEAQNVFDFKEGKLAEQSQGRSDPQNDQRDLKIQSLTCDGLAQDFGAAALWQYIGSQLGIMDALLSQNDFAFFTVAEIEILLKCASE